MKPCRVESRIVDRGTRCDEKQPLPVIRVPPPSPSPQRSLGLLDRRVVQQRLVLCQYDTQDAFIYILRTHLGLLDAL